MEPDDGGVDESLVEASSLESSFSLVCRGPVNSIRKWLNFYVTTEGPCVAVYDEQRMHLIASKKIFSGQNLHGLRPIPDRSTDSEEAELEAAFLAYGGRFFTRFVLRVELQTSAVDIIHVAPIHSLGDWIWDMQAFVDGSQSALLSHNQLMSFNRKDQPPFSGHCTPETVKCTFCDIHCILYSGQIVGNIPDKVVVAAGTVFNEVLLWDGTSGRVLHTLKGHQGVIFSVSVFLNLNMIVSTSDDRSAHIYRIEHSSTATPENLADATITQVAILFGHGSRVWRAALLNRNVVTVGEDGFLCLWDSVSSKLLGRRQVPGRGSVSAVLTNGDVVIIGGMAGSLSAININSLTLTGFPRDNLWNVSIPAKEQGVSSVTMDRDRLVISTVMTYMLRHVGSAVPDWTFQFPIEESTNYAVAVQRSGYFFSACIVGFVHSFAVDNQLVIWDRQRIHQGRVFSLICFENPFADSPVHVLSTGSSGHMYLMRFCSQQKSLLKIKSLVLPPSSEQCATCALQVSPNRLLVGDRDGSVFLYSVDRHALTMPMSGLKSLHGPNGSTDLKRDSRERILSAGRDGKIYELAIQNNSLTCLRTFWQHTNIEWIGRLLPYGDRLLIACYQAGDFMLHDVDSEYTLMSMATGGGHRLWDCSVDGNRFHYARMYKHDILVDSINIDERLAHVMKSAGHSKKVNCVVSLWETPIRTVVATGGEDNLLIISEIYSNRTMRPKVRLFEHISSVKSVAVCDFLSDKLMVSVGGRGQLIVWWVNCAGLSVKMMDKHFIWNTDRQHSNRKTPWKNPSYNVKTDALTRYMAVSVRRHGDVRRTPRFQILASGSDALIRLFSYRVGMNIEINHVVEDCTACHLQTKWLGPKSFLAAATDGVLKVYSVSPEAAASTSAGGSATIDDFRITSVGSAQVHKSGVNAVAVQNRCLATGGDDTAITLSRISEDGSIEIVCRVDNAHATQVTGLSWIADDLLLSVSIDQRVTLWKLTSHNELEATWTTMTAVADVSSLTPLANNRYLLIAGQGQEVIALPERESSSGL